MRHDDREVDVRTGRLPLRVAVVIPACNVEREIARVISSVPAWVRHVLVVEDGSRDGTFEVARGLIDQRAGLEVIRHPVNQGVGAAMVTGFRRAQALEADFIVKLDGDGQMDPIHLPALLRPLVEGRADYAKGNRFGHLRDLARMPRKRLWGNVALTFLTKLASGYWHVFDAQNGYAAITARALRALSLDRVERGYAFENSMLSLLNVEGFAVADVAMPAVYGSEISNMKLPRIMVSFPPKLIWMFLRRVFMRYVLYDVSPIAAYLAAGGLLGSFGLVFGGLHWWRSIATGAPATSGTVLLAVLPLLMAFDLLLHAVNLDIAETPTMRPPACDVSEGDIPALFGVRAPTVENPDA